MDVVYFSYIICIVRVDGEVVLHQHDGTYKPGAWEEVVNRAAAEIEEAGSKEGSDQ